jgi:hypothetical protein
MNEITAVGKTCDFHRLGRNGRHQKSCNNQEFHFVFLVDLANYNESWSVVS